MGKENLKDKITGGHFAGNGRLCVYGKRLPKPQDFPPEGADDEEGDQAGKGADEADLPPFRLTVVPGAEVDGGGAGGVVGQAPHDARFAAQG